MAKDQTQDIELGITRLEYGDAARPQRGVLTIETGKHYNGGISCRASVYWVGGHSRSQAITLGGSGGGDFSHYLHKSERTLKATQRNIDKIHAAVYTPEAIEALTNRAKEHYAADVAKGKDSYGNIYVVPTEVQHGA